MKDNTKVIPNILKGYQKFHNTYFTNKPTIYDSLKDIQKPDILIIACCDSRIDPAILFQLEPGQAFVVRNIGNIVGPYGSASNATFSALEYGIKVLQIKNIIVLGHSGCGAIDALVNPIDGFEYIDSWLENHKKTLIKAQPILLKKCEQESILLSIKNLETFPFIRDRVTLTGMYFDISTGKLLQLRIRGSG